MSVFASYDSYSPSGTSIVPLHPYMMNATFPASGENNDFLTEDSLATEYFLLYGHTMTFMPRELYKADEIFGEYLSPTFEKGYQIRMHVDENQAWGGGGDMYSKFGLQVTDELQAFINKSSFLAQTNNTYPKIGDLLFHHVSNKLFSINGIENEIFPSFYRLGQNNMYKFSCKLFAFNHEVISQDVSGSAPTGIPLQIQALDNLLNDLTGTNTMVTLEQKDFNNNNAPIISNANSIIDNTEIDPLLG